MANKGVKVEQVPMEQAYRRLGEIVRRVRASDEVFLLLKGGVPAAAVIDVADFERCILEPNQLVLRWGKDGVVLRSTESDMNGAGALDGPADPKRRRAKTKG